MRDLFGDVVELLKDRANRDLISKEDCGAAGMHEAILWNTTSKVGYIVKLLHLAKEHELFALTPTDDGPLPDLIQQLTYETNANHYLRCRRGGRPSTQEQELVGLGSGRRTT